MLGEEIGELTQLEQGSVGVFREVALGEHAEAHELIVVFGALGEVGGERRAWDG